MSSKFWFWWDVCFAAFCAVMVPVSYLNDLPLLNKIWYPIAVVLFAGLAYLQWTFIKEDNERS